MTPGREKFFLYTSMISLQNNNEHQQNAAVLCGVLLCNIHRTNFFSKKSTKGFASISIKSWLVILNRKLSPNYDPCFNKEKKHWWNCRVTFGCLATSFISSRVSGTCTGTTSFCSNATYRGATGSITCNKILMSKHWNVL